MSSLTQFFAGFGTVPPALPSSWVTRVDLVCPVIDLAIKRGGGTRFAPVADSYLITVDGRSGAVDPSNPAGPYYGQLIPGVPIQITENIDGNNRTLCTGYVLKWPTTWDQGSSTVTIEATDLKGWLAQAEMPRSELVRVISALDPVQWWPCDSVDAVTYAANRRGGFELTANQGKLGDPTFVPYDPAPAFSGAGQGTLGSGTLGSAGTDCGLPDPPFTIVFFGQVDNMGAAATLTFLFLTKAGGNFTLFGGINGTTQFSASRYLGGTPRATPVGAGDFVPNTPFLYAVSVDAAGLTRLWHQMSGQAAPVANSAAGTPDPITRNLQLTIGAITPSTVGWTMRVSNLMFFNRVLNSTEMGQLGNAALVGRAGETAADRVNFLLDLANVPAGLRAVGALGDVCAGLHLDADLLTLLGRTATAAAASVYTDRLGVLHVDPPLAVAPAPAVSIGLEGGTDMAYDAFNLEVDEVDAVTEATVGGQYPNRYARPTPPGLVRTLALPTDVIGSTELAFRRVEWEVWRGGLATVRAVAGLNLSRADVDRMALTLLNAGNQGVVVKASWKPPWAAAAVSALFWVSQSTLSNPGPRAGRLDLVLEPVMPTRTRWEATGASGNGWVKANTATGNLATGSDDLTVLARVQPTAWSDTTLRLVVGKTTSAGASPGWALFVGNGRIYLYLSSLSAFATSPLHMIPDGRPSWVYVLVATGATTTTVTFFTSDTGASTDFRLVGASTLAGVATLNSAVALAIGYNPAAPAANPFSGWLDQVYIENYTTGAILSIFDPNGRGTAVGATLVADPEAPLVAWLAAGAAVIAAYR